MNFNKKTLGFLINELATVNVKIITSSGNADELESRRQDLIDAIDGKDTSGLERSLGQLVDELTTTNIKSYFVMENEIVAQREKRYEDAGKFGEQVLAFSARRKNLINAIDGSDTLTKKTYGEDAK